MALKKLVFVREETDRSDGKKYLLAFEILQEAIEGDGPTLVGTYKLVETRRLVKILREIKTRRR